MILTYLKKIFNILIPNQLKLKIVSKFEQRKQRNYLIQLKTNIIRFYESKESMTKEEEEVINYLESNPISVFPYDFQEKYNKSDIMVLEDSSNGLRYVLHENKKLYFKRSYTDAKIKSLYHGLMLDQDPNSPHLYLTKDFSLNSKDVIADIGAAEGNFSLSNIERIQKIYLFECDSEWIEALEATFSPWKEKVVICNKFVSNNDNNDSITLDTFIKQYDDITFLKVDIEGEEANFLEGAHGFLQSNKQFKLAICTYHKQEDQAEFTQLLKSYNLEVQPSNRYMIFYHDLTIKAPFLRRGLLRAQKKTIINE